MNLLGIDIGTTGCKVSILTPHGEIIATNYSEYPQTITTIGYQELEPKTIWNLVNELIFSCMQNTDKNSIKGIGVASFGESFVCLDIDGNILHNAILYTDSRGDSQLEKLENLITKDEFLKQTGSYPSPMYSLSKILWIKENLPEIYERTHAMLSLDAYILNCLGAKPVVSYAQAARTGLFDVVDKKWSTKIADISKIDLSKFPEIINPGKVVGEVSQSAAKACGLIAGIPLVIGGHDQQCCSLGMGAVRSGMASASLGSVESINPVFDKPILNTQMADNYFACVPYLSDDQYITYAFSFTAGRLFKWYKNTLAIDAVIRAETNNINVYDLLISEMSDDSGELFLLPYFSGAATPYMDYDVKGMITGLDLDTNQSQLTRALLEGITFESMVNVERLKLAGVNIDDLRVTGGLARNSRFLQMKADMMSIPLTIVKNEEAGTVGVAMLVGLATGVFSNLDEALENMVHIGSRFEPNIKNHEKYLEKFETYKKLYPAQKSIYI